MANSLISIDLKIYTTKNSLQRHLRKLKETGKTIGFVPTMGALHQGHISLIEQARKNCDMVVCSIFVNPNQFNDFYDFDNYPRTIEADIKLLKTAKCDVLFNPAVNEIYKDSEQWHLNIGETEHLLEGKFRPGHYQGVTQVVYKLLNIVMPDTAFFGQKDYQQFLIISKMAQNINMPINLVMCPIMRDMDGLAMSSRNIHLTAADRQHALILSKTLNWVRDNFNAHKIHLLKKEAEHCIQAAQGLELDYFEIADGETLHPADENSTNIVALVAAKVGKTRLIDNVLLVHG